METDKVLKWLMKSQQQQTAHQQHQAQQLLQQIVAQQEQMMQELATQHQEQERLIQQVASLMQPTGMSARSTIGPDTGALPAILLVRLTKMGPSNDLQAFLVTFERVATTTWWSPKQWAMLLAPYLTKTAQATYQDPQDALVYGKVKAAILDQMGINPKTYHQHLHRERYPTWARPRVVAQCLRDCMWRSLESEKRSGAQVAGAVVLEQFTQILPGEGVQWQ